MHEMALAEGVIATALATGREHGRRVCRIIVKVGELQQIDPEVFRSCLDHMRPDDEPLLEGVDICLGTERLALRCRACGRDYHIDDLETPPSPEELEAIHFVPELAHSCIHCPGCGSPDFAVTAGRGVWIDALEVET